MNLVVLGALACFALMIILRVLLIRCIVSYCCGICFGGFTFCDFGFELAFLGFDTWLLLGF